MKWGLSGKYLILLENYENLAVDRVTVTADGIIVDLRTAGLGTLVRDLLAPRSLESVA
jgi:hypothetical protein